MNCEICEQTKKNFQLTYQPNEKMKVYSSLSNLQNKGAEQRNFCSSECLKKWCELPDNWK